MNLGVENLFHNIGFSFETVFLICFLLTSIVFFARDFKIGLVFILLGSGATFLWFYSWGLNWAPILIVFLMDLVVMSFTLYFVNKAVQAGGFI